MSSILASLQSNARYLRLCRWVVLAIHLLFTYLLLTPDPYAKADVFQSIYDIQPEGYIIHLGVYFGLAFTIQAVTTKAKYNSMGVAYISAHGLLSEYGQSFVPGRTCDPWDTLANVVGIGIAVIWYHAIAREPTSVDGASFVANAAEASSTRAAGS